MCFQIRAREFLCLASELKRDHPQIPVIAGGHFASCAADELLAHHPELDLIAFHEAEETIVALAGLPAWTPASLATVDGIVYRDGDAIVRTRPRPIHEDLDTLPRPDRSAPSRLIAEEMGWLYHERGVRQFVFHDDNFLLPSEAQNLARVDALERAMRGEGVRHAGLVEEFLA